MSKPNIAILQGTARPQCYSHKMAEYVADILQEDERAEVELHKASEFLQEMTVPPWQEEYSKEIKDWRAVADRADAFIIVSPEYNHGYPGELKIVLDEEYENYSGKPVLTCAVSSGGFGGTRLVEHIIPVYNELGLINVPEPIYVSHVHDLFDEKSREERDEQYKERVESSFDKLLLYQKHLDGLHEELN